MFPKNGAPYVVLQKCLFPLAPVPMAGFPNIDRGAPGSIESTDTGFGKKAIDWGFGWVTAATFAVPRHLRRRAALLLLAALLAFIEERGPQRASQWARLFATDQGTGINTEHIRRIFHLLQLWHSPPPTESGQKRHRSTRGNDE